MISDRYLEIFDEEAKGFSGYMLDTVTKLALNADLDESKVSKHRLYNSLKEYQLTNYQYKLTNE